MPRLSEYGTMDKTGVTHGLQDIAGEEVTILDAKLSEGEFGTFAIMTIADKTGEKMTIVTGAMLVMDAVRDWMARGEGPVQATFARKGRVWTFV